MWITEKIHDENKTRINLSEQMFTNKKIKTTESLQMRFVTEVKTL